MVSVYMKSTGELLLFSKHVLIFCPSYSDVPNRRLCKFVTTVMFITEISLYAIYFWTFFPLMYAY